MEDSFSSKTPVKVIRNETTNNPKCPSSRSAVSVVGINWLDEADGTSSLCVSVCPGGLEAPCGNHGDCNDGLQGSGSCKCHEGFRGQACELCQDRHYGSNCTGLFSASKFKHLKSV